MSSQVNVQDPYVVTVTSKNTFHIIYFQKTIEFNKG